MSDPVEISLPFRPRGRILRLLGDQLIRSPSIAVFELVKNAFDADASTAEVVLDLDSPDGGRITVQDDGSGMSLQTITGVWLEPGTDLRARQRQGTQPRSPRYGRLPIGEKGVGRFAAAKLGNRLQVTTRSSQEDEVVVDLDWDLMSSSEYLEDVRVHIITREPEVFVGDRTGTRIEIEDLRDSWTASMTRELHRSITSITSPFERVGDFVPSLRVPGHQDWTAGLMDTQTMLASAPFYAKALLAGTTMSYEYAFRPSPSSGLEPRRSTQTVELTGKRGEAVVDLNQYKIGSIELTMFIFDRDPAVLRWWGNAQNLRAFLDFNGGVRVYRDGIRVYDYGEPGNDWLSLDVGRVNTPTKRLSNNVLVAGVELRLDSSSDLVEKTNREGFVENGAYRTFQAAVVSAVQQITIERNQDKERVRRVSGGQPRRPVLDSISELRTLVGVREELKDLAPRIDAIEREYQDLEERLLGAAGVGLSLAVVIHEVEKAAMDLVAAVEAGQSHSRLRLMAAHLEKLVKGLSGMLRGGARDTTSASDLVLSALFNFEYRLRAHNITVINSITKANNFSLVASRRLVVATIMNILDNAIYWVEIAQPSRKLIYFGTAKLGGDAIVIGDNGPGFRDPPELLTQPFMSRRPDGMGIGLHLASEIMTANDGTVEFPDRRAAHAPPEITGAIVALVFKVGGAS